MFTIENNVPFDNLNKGRKEQEKQALFNTVGVMKNGDSIFIPNTTLGKGTLKKYLDVAQQRNLSKEFRTKSVLENQVEGTRIWCFTKKP